MLNSLFKLSLSLNTHILHRTCVNRQLIYTFSLLLESFLIKKQQCMNTYPVVDGSTKKLVAVVFKLYLLLLLLSCSGWEETIQIIYVQVHKFKNFKERQHENASFPQYLEPFTLIPTYPSFLFMFYFFVFIKISPNLKLTRRISTDKIVQSFNCDNTMSNNTWNCFGVSVWKNRKQFWTGSFIRAHW